MSTLLLTQNSLSSTGPKGNWGSAGRESNSNAQSNLATAGHWHVDFQAVMAAKASKPQALEQSSLLLLIITKQFKTHFDCRILLQAKLTKVNKKSYSLVPSL